MRIGLFTHVYAPMINGIAVSTKTLEEELIKQGHEVYVITNNYCQLKNDFSPPHFKVVSIPIYYQNLRTPVLYNPELFRELDKLNLDVIHSHSDFGIGVMSRVYASLHESPHIQTYHCNYVEYANNNFGNLAGILSKGPVKLYSKYLSATTDRLISPSKENVRLLSEDFGIKRTIDFIPNGIDLSRFRDINFGRVEELKKQYGFTDDDFVLLSLSRLSKEKRIDEILQILPKLKECSNLKLLVVGDGPDALNLKRIAGNLNLDNVIFTCEVQHEETPYYYRLASAFVTNSVAETQGLTVIESLASSIPVICINSMLYKDIVINDKNGVTYENEEHLVEVIRSLYKNRDALSKMREHTELSVLKYSIEATTKKIVGVYSEEIENAANRNNRGNIK